MNLSEIEISLNQHFSTKEGEDLLDSILREIDLLIDYFYETKKGYLEQVSIISEDFEENKAAESIVHTFVNVFVVYIEKRFTESIVNAASKAIDYPKHQRRKKSATKKVAFLARRKKLAIIAKGIKKTPALLIFAEVIDLLDIYSFLKDQNESKRRHIQAVKKFAFRSYIHEQNLKLVEDKANFKSFVNRKLKEDKEDPGIKALIYAWSLLHFFTQKNNYGLNVFDSFKVELYYNMLKLFKVSINIKCKLVENDIYVKSLTFSNSTLSSFFEDLVKSNLALYHFYSFITYELYPTRVDLTTLTIELELKAKGLPNKTFHIFVKKDYIFDSTEYEAYPSYSEFSHYMVENGYRDFLSSTSRNKSVFQVPNALMGISFKNFSNASENTIGKFINSNDMILDELIRL